MSSGYVASIPQLTTTLPRLQSGNFTGRYAVGGANRQKVFANAGMQQITPRLTTDGSFDAVERKFKKMVGGDPKGRKELWAQWHAIDYNGNGIVSLAEIDKWVVERFATVLNNKPALMRAYKASVLGEQDGYVHKIDFPVLLRNVVYFNKLWTIFENVDGDADRRLTFAEFRHGLNKLGLVGKDPQTVFNQLDVNKGGIVLFDEFCKWVAQVECPVDNTVYDPSVMAHPAAGGGAAGHTGGGGTRSVSYHTEGANQAGDLSLDLPGEAEFRQVLKDKRKMHAMWKRIDYNGNGLVSLAEIDKLFVEGNALLACRGKAPLMRAYKATMRTGDSFVHKGEFRQLLRNLLYFNKVWLLYDIIDTDNDKRMNFQEFQVSSSKLGIHLSSKEAQDEFDFMDTNNGGMVLFDEFCKWVAQKKLPLD